MDGDELMAALQRFDYLYTPYILAVSVAYILLKGWRFVLLMRPGEESTHPVASGEPG